jgi:4'-phosphopantetheinyl transferase
VTGPRRPFDRAQDTPFGRAQDRPTIEPRARHRFGEVWLVRTDAAARAAVPPQRLTGFPDIVVQRAARLRDAEQQAQYLYAHKLLHELLCSRVGQPEWNITALGKPDCGARGPAFSLSRRGAWAAFVIGTDASPLLGVDLEIAHHIDDPLDFARDHFTPRELTALRAEPVPDRAYAFLRAWTRKEAVMKAVGLGVSLPARSFHVGLGRDAVSLRVAHEGRSWDVELESVLDEGDTIVAVARAVPVGPD